MLTVKFYDKIADDKMKFAVIVCRASGKWVFCRHRERNTYELPGGHRENGEAILDTAKRELYEETGAVDYHIRPVCVYSVTGKNRISQTGEETFGMLYYADIRKFSEMLHSEIAQIYLLDSLPKQWTYPEIQPKLLERAIKK